MPDLSTTYLGLKLRSPLVASASPLSQNIGNILHMEDAGIAAVVLHSLFEEQIEIESHTLDRHLSAAAESYHESLTYFPDLTSYNIGPHEYVEHIRRTKRAVDIPVIGSLNGVSTGGWIRYAKLIEEAGADALELNIYFLPSDPSVEGAAVEQQYVELVSHVKASVRIPVAVKLGPYFSSIPNMAVKLDRAGADGLVLFNRFYQPDYDLETLEVVPNLVLSTSSELLTRIHWVAMLYGHIKADMAVTGGVHTALDVLKSMMAGAKVAMMTSALLRHGIDYAARIERDLIEWMEKHEYESIRQMQGSMSARNVSDPAAFQRANYMKVLSSYDLRARPAVQ
jgi:dihydroorotate dehydrogenase (fumarate)